MIGALKDFTTLMCADYTPYETIVPMSIVSFFTRKYVTARPADWIVLGLGNPGDKYAGTRHNVGYGGVDKLLSRSGTGMRPVKGQPVVVANATVAGASVLLARSTTYMNNSGEAIAQLCHDLHVPADHVIVLHDELDLPHGKLRIKQGGNENGHNGLKSVSALLGTREYVRVRMGISRPPAGTPVPDYVLGPVTHDDALEAMLEHAADAVEIIVSQGIAAAQNALHSR